MTIDPHGPASSASDRVETEPEAAHGSDRPVMLTGASGTIGRLLARRLGSLGWPLRLTDISPFPDPLPPGASFTLANLEDRDAMASIAEGCRLILHFGGVSTEQPFDAVSGPNLRGCCNVFEAARRERARVVFASSNHAVGLYERSVVLDHDCLLRPDGHYGLSKAFGEMLARMYWEKHAVESVVIRIGSVLPDVPDERILSTWISPDDFVGLIERCGAAARVDYAVIWGASNNARSFWRRDDRARIGWIPRDSSDPQATRVAGRVTDDPIAERYQGGRFVSIDFTRADFVPSAMFAK